MRGVILVWSGFVAAAVALLALLRPKGLLGIAQRRRVLPWAAGAAALLAAGALSPAPSRRAPGTRTRLDAIVTEWQFDELHATRVRAAPAAVERALHAVTAREIRLFRLLTWLRNPRLPGRQRASILAPPADEPILAVALRSGFWLLAAEPGREVVVGTLVIRPDGSGLPPRELGPALAAGLTGEQFAALAAPGNAKAAMSFRFVDDGDGWTRLTTETRIAVTDARTHRRFALYWRTIYPGSALIRRMWLQAIRRRAEAEGRA